MDGDNIHSMMASQEAVDSLMDLLTTSIRYRHPSGGRQSDIRLLWLARRLWTALWTCSRDLCPSLAAVVLPEPTTYFFPRRTLFHLIFPHRLASWAGSLSGSPVSYYVCLVVRSVADPGCLSRNPDPGSELFPIRIQDPGSASKNLSILTQKMVSKLWEI